MTGNHDFRVIYITLTKKLEIMIQCWKQIGTRSVICYAVTNFILLNIIVRLESQIQYTFYSIYILYSYSGKSQRYFDCSSMVLYGIKKLKKQRTESELCLNASVYNKIYMSGPTELKSPYNLPTLGTDRWHTKLSQLEHLKTNIRSGDNCYMNIFIYISMITSRSISSMIIINQT